MTLKLRAEDADDVQVISAVLQDAIVPVCDMVWRAGDKNFIMVAQRLCRETDDGSRLERICCALNVRGVESVQTHGLDLHERDRMLDLLMMMLDGNILQLLFAGGAKIRMQMSNGWMVAEDFGEPWPAGCNPCHDSTTAQNQQT